MSERLLTPEQVSERLQVVPRTVYRWLSTGELQGVKLGRLWRVREEDLEAFILAHRIAPGLENDEPTAEEVAEAAKAWQDHLAGRDPGKPLDQVIREQLHERRD